MYACMYVCIPYTLYTAPSLAARWPNIPGMGLLMLNAIWRFYVIAKNATVQWFDSDKLPTIKRHVLNQRELGGHEESVLMRIRDEGVQIIYRGKPVLVAIEHEGHYTTLCAGTMCDQFYEALLFFDFMIIIYMIIIMIIVINNNNIYSYDL